MKLPHLTQFLTGVHARPVLRPHPAPDGWTAALLEADYPLSEQALPYYTAAVDELLRRIPALQRAAPEEVLLQFDRCRPAAEIPILQENGRAWLPEFGLGVWFDRDLPTLWTEDEFLGASPGQLRPFLYRIVRIQPQPPAQRSAWTRLLGSGVLVRITLTEPGTLLRTATTLLQPMMTERSLSSFPFYAPLLAGDLSRPHPVYAEPFREIFSHADAYLRESAEDGGLLLFVRQSPETFWPAFSSADSLRVLQPASNSTDGI